jgi:hypothetical protein
MSNNLPDLNEISGMAKTFFGDVVNSIQKIVGEYKEKHAHTEAAQSCSKVDSGAEATKVDSETSVTHEESTKPKDSETN